MDYRDLGRMLREIASWKNMTNMEKAYLWSTVATERRKQLTIMNDYVPDAVIDSRSPENTANHIVLPFYDEYHGPMAAMSDEEALRVINAHESQIWGIPTPFNWNRGDTESSIRMTRTFRAAAAVTGDITGLVKVADRLQKKEYGGILHAAYSAGVVLDQTVNTVNAAIKSLKTGARTEAPAMAPRTQ